VAQSSADQRWRRRRCGQTASRGEGRHGKRRCCCLPNAEWPPGPASRSCQAGARLQIVGNLCHIHTQCTWNYRRVWEFNAPVRFGETNDKILATPLPLYALAHRFPGYWYFNLCVTKAEVFGLNDGFQWRSHEKRGARAPTPLRLGHVGIAGIREHLVVGVRSPVAGRAKRCFWSDKKNKSLPSDTFPGITYLNAFVFVPPRTSHRASAFPYIPSWIWGTTANCLNASAAKYNSLFTWQRAAALTTGVYAAT